MHIHLDKGDAHAATCQRYKEQTSFVPGSVIGKESVLGPASWLGRIGGGEALRQGWTRERDGNSADCRASAQPESGGVRGIL